LEYFDNNKYEQSSYYLRLLKKLHDILDNNDRIKIYYDELTKIIQEKSDKEVVYFEKLILKIINCENC
jgi:hypothetical protein